MFHTLGHHRSHGFALLVALLAFPAIAQWSANDSYRLDQIYLQLGGDYNSSHSIHSDLAQVLSLQRGVFNVSSNTYELLDQFFDEFRDVLSPDGDGGYDAVNIDFNLDGYTPYVHRGLPYDERTSAELLVTNRAETYWLERIARSRYIPFDFNAFLNGNPSQGNATALSTLVNYYMSLNDAYLAGDYSRVASLYSSIYNRFGTWRWEPWNSFFTLNPNILIGARGNTNNFVKFLSNMTQTDYGRNAYGVYWSSYYDQYSTRSLREHLMTYFNNTGLSTDNFNPTNFFTADGTIENTDNAFTNSETSVFNKFATSFLPSCLFDPEEVDTNLFEYVDADISPTPTFNPQPLQGGTRSRSSASFDYDFDDSEDYSYNLLNPLKTATDQVQNDTDIDNKFQSLADLVNQRLSSIFDSPLNSISQQPSRWSVKFRDKDGHSSEEYVSSQQSETSEGITFVCWVIESTMFAGFFFTCVRRSLRIGFAGDPPA